MSKQQLGKAFEVSKFVGWKAVILKSSTKAATPCDIMMTVVSGAVSILDNMHAEGIRGHTVSLSGLAVLGRIRESKKPNVVVKCVQIYQHDKCGFEIVIFKTPVNLEGKLRFKCSFVA